MSIARSHTRVVLRPDDPPLPENFEASIGAAATEGESFANQHLAVFPLPGCESALHAARHRFIGMAQMSQTARKALFGTFYAAAADWLFQHARSPHARDSARVCRNRAREELTKAFLWSDAKRRERIFGWTPVRRLPTGRSLLTESIAIGNVAEELLAMEMVPFYPNDTLTHTDLLTTGSDGKSGLCIMVRTARNRIRTSRGTLVESAAHAEPRHLFDRTFAGLYEETALVQRRIRGIWKPVALEVVYPDATGWDATPVSLRSALARSIRAFDPAFAR